MEVWMSGMSCILAVGGFAVPAFVVFLGDRIVREC
jgi:hypothetical protein